MSRLGYRKPRLCPDCGSKDAAAFYESSKTSRCKACWRKYQNAYYVPRRAQKITEVVRAAPRGESASLLNVLTLSWGR